MQTQSHSLTSALAVIFSTTVLGTSAPVVSPLQLLLRTSPNRVVCRKHGGFYLSCPGFFPPFFSESKTVTTEYFVFSQERENRNT